jgi:hypothetical protein
MARMSNLIKLCDVQEILDMYRKELQTQQKSFPKDLAVHYRISAVNDIELRLKLLRRNGLKVIEGGKK